MFWARLAALVAAPFVLARAVGAQGQELLLEVEPSEVPAAAGADVVAELQALRDELGALLERVNRLEAEKSTVTATVIVQDAQKKTIFRVGLFNDRPHLELGAPDTGRAALLITDGGSQAIFSDSAGVQSAIVRANVTTSIIVVSDKLSTVIMGTSLNAHTGIQIEDGDR